MNRSIKMSVGRIFLDRNRERKIKPMILLCTFLLVISVATPMVTGLGYHGEQDDTMSDVGLYYNHEPMPEADEAMESDEKVTVTEQGDHGDGLDQITFDPVDENPSVGMAFAAGMEVNPRVYAPLARAIAEEGYFVVLFYADTMAPSGGPFYDVMPNYPEIEEWSVGGHSHGGVCAADYFDDEEPEGLNLWASYPNPGILGFGETDLSDKEGEFASIYGTEDGLTTVDDIEDSEQRLPDDTDFVEIAGGNHAQFGWYGEQSGDGEATISREEQQDIIVSSSLEHLDAIRGVMTFELTIDAGEGGTTDPEPGTHTYEEGEEAVVKALPEAGYEFVEWTGDHEGTEEEITITMDGDKQIIAHFQEEETEGYVLRVNTQGEGEVNIDPDQEEYEEGTEVTLTANPADDWEFVEWSGDADGTEDTTTVVMDDHKDVTAHFEEDVEYYGLTVNIDGEGEVNIVPDQEEYEEGTEVTLTAEPYFDWEFVEWTGDYEGTEEEISLIMDQDYELTAHFEEIFVEYDLTIEAGEGGTTDPEPGTHPYEEGEEVTITAIPDEGYEFVEWTGDYEGTEEEITIEMDDDKEVTALFEEDVEYYELTVDVEGEGTVEVDPEQEEYEEGTEVTLTAVPEDGNEFVEWTGDYEGTEEQITIEMDDDKEITAWFQEEVEYYELTVDIEGEGTVEVDGEEVEGGETLEIEEDEEVTLEAIADDDWEFVEWTGDNEDEEAEITLTMDQDYDLTAWFQEEVITYELTIDVEGDGNVSVEFDGQEVEVQGYETFDIEEGTEVTLTAVPDDGWEFVEWNREDEEDEITLTMDDHKEITALFEEEEDDETPGFTFVLLAVALITTVAIYHKKKA